MFRLSAILILFLFSSAEAQKIKPIETVKAEMGRVPQIIIEADGPIFWKVLGDYDVWREYPPENAPANSLYLRVPSPKTPGKIQIVAYCVKDGKGSPIQIIEVVFGNPVPPKPDPVIPKPDPKKPDPPKPEPIAPKDPFVKSLQEAYMLERGDTKDGDRLHLIEVYKRGQVTAVDQSVTQAVTLFTSLQTHRMDRIPGDRFSEVRKVISKELDSVLPTAVSAQLDATNRSKCVNAFKKIVSALEAIK